MGARAFTSPEVHLEGLFPGDTPVTSTASRISQEAVFIPDSLNAETLQKVLLMEVWARLGKQRGGGERHWSLSKSGNRHHLSSRKDKGSS